MLFNIAGYEMVKNKTKQKTKSKDKNHEEIPPFRMTDRCAKGLHRKQPAAIISHQSSSNIRYLR
jgi:hypothetical protein